jgi:glucokinase
VTPQLHSERPAAALAIDIGGTTLKGAAFDRTGQLVAQKTIGTFDHNGDAFAGVLALLQALRSDALVAGFSLAGIGLASPGLVDPASGTITFAANLRWDMLPLRELLQAEFHVPVHVGHDARMGATAEQAAQASLGDDVLRHFIFIPIGTGVSAAVVTSGVLVEGVAGAAGEFGHMQVIPGGERCSCGQRGCIEAYASAASMFSRYQHRGGTLASSAQDIARTLDTDPTGALVWGDAIDALSTGIVALTAVLDPAVIVIGGGVSAAGETLLVPLRTRVAERLAWRSTPLIVRSALTSHGGLIGAALVAWSGHTLAHTFTAEAHRSLAVDPATSLPATVQPTTHPVMERDL